MPRVERRESVRIPAKLAMEIRIGGGNSTKVKSLNVSANGVYFSSDKYIPVLTKLDITLDLPRPDNENSAGEGVVCRGVVVRTEPEEENAERTEYQIACYFTSIDEADKETLEAYILRQVAF